MIPTTASVRRIGPRQLPLFSRDEMAAVADSCGSPRSLRSDCAAVHERAAQPDGRAPEGHHLVALWHDRAWKPLRLFKRSDGATIVVFRIDGAN
jgi:hypothetical protein